MMEVMRIIELWEERIWASGGGGGCGGAACVRGRRQNSSSFMPGDSLISVLLCMNLLRELRSFIRGERRDGGKRGNVKKGRGGGKKEYCAEIICFLIKLLLPDADVGDREDYAVAD